MSRQSCRWFRKSPKKKKKKKIPPPLSRPYFISDHSAWPLVGAYLASVIPSLFFPTHGFPARAWWEWTIGVMHRQMLVMRASRRRVLKIAVTAFVLSKGYVHTGRGSARWISTSTEFGHDFGRSSAWTPSRSHCRPTSATALPCSITHPADLRGIFRIIGYKEKKKTASSPIPCRPNKLWEIATYRT